MSQKSGKKLRKRTDDEVETSKTAGDEINIKEKTENGIDKEERCNEEKTEETELNNINNDNSHPVGEQAEKSEKDEEIKEIIVYTVNVTEDIIIETETTQTQDDTCILNINNKEHDNNEEIKEENEEMKINIKITTESEMEPLILETEEVDPELEFDENSDVDSQKSSPKNRCRTRRSQTRNIPTPKTPKVIDPNDDKSSESSDKPSVVTVPTPEVTDTESEASIFKSVTDIYDPKEKLLRKNSEEFDSFQNISTKAVVGSDTTRNVDLSLYPDDEFEFSPFLTQSRERSVGETLKLLSSRRSIKSTKDYTLQNNNKKDYKTLPPLVTRKAFEKSTGTKRKNTDAPDYSKRFKSESPHLLSYISSPIANFKNRFVKSEIPSSTPKLTGYKSKHVFDNTNVSKISLNETEDAAEKKWCAIM